jgi:hypothetical protein
MKLIKILILIVVMSFLMGCSDLIGYGTLQNREIKKSKDGFSHYTVEINDDGCNCTRVFIIYRYDDWYKPKIGSKVAIKATFFTNYMVEDKD